MGGAEWGGEDKLQRNQDQGCQIVGVGGGEGGAFRALPRATALRPRLHCLQPGPIRVSCVEAASLGSPVLPSLPESCICAPPAALSTLQRPGLSTRHHTKVLSVSPKAPVAGLCLQPTLQPTDSLTLNPLITILVCPEPSAQSNAPLSALPSCPALHLCPSGPITLSPWVVTQWCGNTAGEADA